MNTFALMQNLLESAQRLAGQNGRITALFVAVGELLNVDDDEWRSVWERLVAGTGAEGAHLHIRRVPAEFSCMICRRLFRSEQREPVCPYCGSMGVKIEHGEECSLEAIELENGIRLP